LPCTISTPVLGGANISYKLRAVIHRPGFAQNLHARLPIAIVRSFTPDSLEYQQSSEIENTWPGKLMYSILLPHKAWAAGDTLTALVKFVPICKGVRILSVTSTIYETVRLSLNRTAAPQYTRPVAVAKHDIIGGKPVRMSEYHYGHRVPLLYHQEDTRGRSSLAPIQCSRQEPPADSSSQAGSSVDGLAEGDNEQSDDLVAQLDVTLPSFLAPTQDVEPITVTHRVRWSILIANPDGHTSELRCSLNIHVLGNHVLSEARAASAPTRRMLLGIYDVPDGSDGEEIQLPSYNAHVCDRVPPTDRPYSFSSGTRTPSSGLQSPASQIHFDTQLPHVPTDAPLEWIASELSRHQLSNNGGRSGDWSAPSSRFPSRLPSRASSPQHGSRSNGQPSPIHSHESRGTFRNRFSAIVSSFSLSPRNHSHQSITPLSQPHTPDTTEAPRRGTTGTNTTQSSPLSSPTSSRTSGYFSEVPDYETASRGFAGGGVPPLTSVRGLPTYDEANALSPIPGSVSPSPLNTL
jgi:hypothetical protein